MRSLTVPGKQHAANHGADINGSVSHLPHGNNDFSLQVGGHAADEVEPFPLAAGHASGNGTARGFQVYPLFGRIDRFAGNRCGPAEFPGREPGQAEFLELFAEEQKSKFGTN
jgi:hypothetical protein